MATQDFAAAPLTPFGIVVDADLSRPLDDEDGAMLRRLMDEHKLLLFRGQSLAEEQQVAVLAHLGRVLGSRGEHRQISSDGNLGAGKLAYHSDLAFTEEPFKFLSLHALEVNDGESWTRFANGVTAVDRIDPALRATIDGRDAVTVLSVIQTHRALSYDVPDFLPQQRRPVIMPHPRTGEPLLYISEMQTARIEGLDREASDAALAALFDLLYAPEQIYEHRWCGGDFLLWDNFALQHARCDLTGMTPRRLQRVAVADKSFFDLLPQFEIGDPRLKTWAAGGELKVDA
jgi:taurine dioxygenase